MGSLSAGGDQHIYPDAADPSLVLAHPTAAEKQQTWRLNHGEWGGALDLSAYLKRELFLASTALSADGGMMHWILTESPSPPQAQAQTRNEGESQDQDERQARRVLASCETIRKRVLYVPATAGNRDDEKGELRVREGLGYGIGSVYTYPEFRGRKYAARILKELSATLKTWPKEEERLRKLKRSREEANGAKTANGTLGDQHKGYGERGEERDCELKEAICSALWSDIGKSFYTSKGWPAFASEHVEFPAIPSPSLPPFSTNTAPHSSSTPNIGIASLFEKSSPSSSTLKLAPINNENLAQLCAEDETHLRAQLIQHARETGCTAFAFAPDVDVFRWHWSREEFIVSHVWPGRQASEVRGMVATVTSTPTPTTTITTVHTQTQQNGNGAANGTPRRADTNNQEKEQEVEEEEDKTRVWAIWTRNYGTDAASNPAKNTLYILRLVIDPPSSPSFSPSSPDLQLAFDAVLHSALDTARAWNCGAVHLWNPTPIARDLISRSGVTHSYVHRDVDSIPSMMWYGPEGEGRENDGEGKGAVDWIANEKYCWC